MVATRKSPRESQRAWPHCYSSPASASKRKERLHAPGSAKVEKDTRSVLKGRKSLRETVGTELKPRRSEAWTLHPRPCEYRSAQPLATRSGKPRWVRQSPGSSASTSRNGGTRVKPALPQQELNSHAQRCVASLCLKPSVSIQKERKVPCSWIRKSREGHQECPNSEDCSQSLALTRNSHWAVLRQL